MAQGHFEYLWVKTQMDRMPIVLFAGHINALGMLLYKHCWTSFASLIFLWGMIKMEFPSPLLYPGTLRLVWQLFRG